MKIIATVTNDLTYDQRMIRICTSLANAGYEVELVGRKLPASKPIRRQKFQQKRLTCWFNKGKFFYIEYNIRLFFYLLFQKQDLICSVDLDTILAGFCLCQLKRKIQIYDAHEYFTEVPEVVRRPKTQSVWEGVARLTIPRIRYCYTVCESLAHIFEAKYGVHFGVIRNLNYQEKKQLSKQNTSDINIILYQGALNEGRGLEALIGAMEQLEGAELWLAGEGDLSKQLRALSKKKGLESKIRFLGFVLPKDLPELSRKASIGINLLENKGLSYYYSLANKTFDYIQANLPSIHMDFPEYQRIMATHEVGVLVKDLEQATLVDALTKLLTDKVYYAQLQANCKVAAEIYHWEKEEEKLLAFYDTIFN